MKQLTFADVNIGQVFKTADGGPFIKAGKSSFLYPLPGLNMMMGKLRMKAKTVVIDVGVLVSDFALYPASATSEVSVTELTRISTLQDSILDSIRTKPEPEIENIGVQDESVKPAKAKKAKGKKAK